MLLFLLDDVQQYPVGLAVAGDDHRLRRVRLEAGA